MVKIYIQHTWNNKTYVSRSPKRYECHVLFFLCAKLQSWMNRILKQDAYSCNAWCISLRKSFMDFATMNRCVQWCPWELLTHPKAKEPCPARPARPHGKVKWQAFCKFCKYTDRDCHPKAFHWSSGNSKKSLEVFPQLSHHGSLGHSCGKHWKKHSKKALVEIQSPLAHHVAKNPCGSMRVSHVFSFAEGWSLAKRKVLYLRRLLDSIGWSGVQLKLKWLSTFLPLSTHKMAEKTKNKNKDTTCPRHNKLQTCQRVLKLSLIFVWNFDIGAKRWLTFPSNSSQADSALGCSCGSLGQRMLSLDDRNHLTAAQVLESRTYFFQEVSVENAKNMKDCESKKTMNITVAYTKEGYSSMLSHPFASELSTNYDPHFTTFGELVAPVGISGPPENDHFTVGAV